VSNSKSDRWLQLRQLLPFNTHEYKRDEQLRLWRWCMWENEPITYEMARVQLHKMPRSEWVVIAVKRGPKGGWTDARWWPAGRALPKYKEKQYYLAYLFDGNVPSHRNVPTSDQWQLVEKMLALQRAHLALHAI
jgi:hypothetical protein